jgi:hypothetical protein
LDQCDAEIITRVGYLIMDIGLQRLPPALQAPAIGAIHCCLDERCDAHADGGMMSFRHA